MILISMKVYITLGKHKYKHKRIFTNLYMCVLYEIYASIIIKYDLWNIFFKVGSR